MGKQLLISFLLLFVVAVAPVAAETAKGDVTLKESTFGPPDGAPQIKLGEAIKLDGTLYVTKFFGQNVITVPTTVKNTADARMMFSYHIALFDKEGNLLGAVSQSSLGTEGVAPGEEMQLGLLISLPPGAMEKVASYQATFYESYKQS